MNETQVMDPVVVESVGGFAVISDIHANLEALEAVLADIDKRGIRRIKCLGDVIGYGPNPVECWRLVRSVTELVIMGNHDLALVTQEMPRFHPRARHAIEWTRTRILAESDGEEILRDIASLPVSVTEGKLLFVHASPVNPTMDYLLPVDAFDRSRMRREFAKFEGYAFNGHTHIPGIIESGRIFEPPEAFSDGVFTLTGRKAIINVGSVGQPRDENPFACYITVEDNGISYHRIKYDVEKTAQKIFDTGELDQFLGRRLLVGR